MDLTEILWWSAGIFLLGILAGAVGMYRVQRKERSRRMGRRRSLLPESIRRRYRQVFGWMVRYRPDDRADPFTLYSGSVCDGAVPHIRSRSEDFRNNNCSISSYNHCRRRSESNKSYRYHGTCNGSSVYRRSAGNSIHEC